METIQKKMVVLKELAQICQTQKRKGKKIVHCHGVFDLLHPGHIYHFHAAKKQGDILIVTLTPDHYVNKGPGRPLFSEQVRAESIAAMGCVDYVAINQWPTAVNTIKLLKPNVYMKGSEYQQKDKDSTGKIYEEEEAVKAIGGVLSFTHEMTFSSSGLIHSQFNVLTPQAKEFLDSFKKQYSANEVIGVLKKMKDLKILVVGDAIVDEYHYCTGLGKTQKDNIIAAKYLSHERFNGGVMAVASHIANFCDHVHLVTLLGRQVSHEEFIRASLKPQVKVKCFFREDAPTTVKQRFLDPSFLGKMLEIYYINDDPPEKTLEDEMDRYLSSCIREYDMVIVSDFGHGMISPKMIKTLTKKARFLAVNAQTNSANRGFNLVIKYPQADYICIDEPELRLAVHDKFCDLKDAMKKLKETIDCAHLMITRGHCGSIGCSGRGKLMQAPIFSQKIVDRVGAGDAFLSLTAPLVYLGAAHEVVHFVGNAVGALAVLIVGNKSYVEPQGLYQYINVLMK